MAITDDGASRRSASDRLIWLAVCSNPHCQWDYVTASPITALLHAHAHNFDLEGQWTHPVYVVNIPAESPPSQNSRAEAA
jgi:hypothetical protein